MRISTTGSISLAAALLATSVYAQNPPNTHTHGTSTVQLVQRNQELVIYVRSPGVDMLGVGRLPINMEEQTKLSQVEDNMRNPAFWIDLPAAAGCNMTRYYPSQHPVIAGRGALQEMSPGKDYSDKGEHMDLNFTYHFHCANPGALDSARIKLFDQFPSIQTVNAKVPGHPVQALSASSNMVQLR
ncbi:ZrgA family zinc uptake protein [Marinobacterium sp. YM272]|uniref:ZrgA family zinc uptake protein n=1 Tax=Marinobacterium sp. YM272 TaxID=3421654 RepID=UPI003D7F1B56